MEKEKLQNTNYDLRKFWNEAYKEENAPATISKNDIEISDALDECLNELAKSSTSILDIGCGDGIMLLEASFFADENARLLGIDSSENAIRYANATAINSKRSNISYKLGGLETLSKMKDGSFDGIICSNFLDVIPVESAIPFIKEIQRLLSKGGHLLFKCNFIIGEKSAKAMNAKVDDEGNVYLSGILRSNNRIDDEWVKSFSPLHLLYKKEYARLGEDRPKDRIFYFEK